VRLNVPGEEARIGIVKSINPEDGSAEIELTPMDKAKHTVISEQRGPGKRPVGMMVGFYGCKGALVRVAWQRTRANQPGPRAVVIHRCPACGHRHGAARFMWRRAHSEEEFNSAMVTL